LFDVAYDAGEIASSIVNSDALDLFLRSGPFFWNAVVGLGRYADTPNLDVLLLSEVVITLLKDVDHSLCRICSNDSGYFFKSSYQQIRMSTILSVPVAL
jgi:hypothetical protein